jgi:hypothetical protein
MRISQDLYTGRTDPDTGDRTGRENQPVEDGLNAMSEQFRAAGGTVYVPSAARNRTVSST